MKGNDEGMKLQVSSISGSYAKVMRQIISGLAFLHGKHIAHRDLKPERVGFWCLFWVLSCAGFCAVGLWCLECFFLTFFLKACRKTRLEYKSVHQHQLVRQMETVINSMKGYCTPPQKSYQKNLNLYSPPQMVTSTRWRYDFPWRRFPPKMWIHPLLRRRTFWSPRWGKQILPTRTDGHDGWDLPRLQTKLGMWCTTRKRLQWQDMTAIRRSRRQVDNKKGFSHKIKYNPCNLHQSFVWIARYSVLRYSIINLNSCGGVCIHMIQHR